MTESNTPAKPHKKESLLFNIGFNVALPAFILMKLSGEEYLGTTWGLIVALLFPIGYGLMDYWSTKKINGFSLLGLASVLLTGGIALLKLKPEYLAIKEASIPAIIGIATLVSMKTKYPIVKTFLYNDKILNTTKISEQLSLNNNLAAFESTLKKTSYVLAASFFLSAILNYLLARWIVTADAGTQAFNEQLGEMTVLSYPVIALPAMIICFGAILYLFRSIKRLTQLDLEQIVVQPN